MNKSELSKKIKELAFQNGFSACGITRAEKLSESETHLKKWLEDKNNADLSYMERNFQMRLDPSLILEGAKSVIVMAINYKAQKRQDSNVCQIASFAYGKDYHIELKKRLELICKQIENFYGKFSYRVFTDSAPILERELARRAGLGWIGKNSCLIIPKIGSLTLICEIICDIELNYDTPFKDDFCGNCRRCKMACPTDAILENKTIDARRCISYHTIESKNQIPKYIKEKLENKIFGCEECLLACPHNKVSCATKDEIFTPNEAFFNLKSENWLEMSEDFFVKNSSESPLKRASLKKLQNNIKKFADN